MKVAVTGAAGFLGRQVCDSVRAAGHEVVGLDAVDGPGTRVVDLRDPDATRAALEGCEGVAHLAGFPRAGTHAPHEVFTTNTSISFSVVDAAVDAGVRRVVYVSSISAVGYPFFEQTIVPCSLPLDASTVSVPQDSYGQSKLVGEVLLTGAVARTAGALTAVSLRFPALHTPESFAAEMPATFSTGKATRLLWAWIDTRDAADAVAAGLGCALPEGSGGHVVAFLAAPETFHWRPTTDLLSEHFPGVPTTQDLAGHASLLDSSAAVTLLGLAPRRSWRDYAGGHPVAPTTGA